MAVRTDAPAGVIEYPTSDGKPMAESDLHRTAINDLIGTLDGYYAGRIDVCVSGNLLVYYAPGDLRKVLAPDCFVAFGVPKRARPWYKTWEEGQFPAVVFEVTSKSTPNDDLTDKLAVYRDVWKVEEYFLFDPLGEYLSPPLQGYRRLDGEFVPIEMTFGQLWSGVMDLYLEAHGPQLHLFEIDTHRRLYTPEVERALAEEARRRQAERERDAERQARKRSDSRAAAAEAEVARLNAELAALRKHPPTA